MIQSELYINTEIKMLETERLLIRIDTEDSYRDAFRSLNEREIKAYFGILSDEDLQKKKGQVADGLTTYRTSLVFFHLIEKTQNKVIGSFAYHNWYPIHYRAELGYSMHGEAFKNKGYMKEAFPLMIAYGFENMSLNRMEAFIHPDNTASKKLVEGMRFQKEGLLKDHYWVDGVVGDSVVYGLLKEQYYS